MKLLSLITWAAATAAASAWAGEETAPKVQLGFFLDTAYAYDRNEPTNFERAYTTSPTRHNEFTLNLMYVEAKVAMDRWRGRVALQTGTSVYANYSSEVRDKTRAGGAQLADYLSLVQEAYAGYRLADRLWVDAGYFFSHIGAESFISRDNWNYTRSLVADFSPYYQSGVKLSYEASSQWNFQLHFLNGWQNLIENNHSKSVGTQVAYTPTENFSVTYNTLLGNEAAFRFFHDLIVKYRPATFWEVAVVGDFGMQDNATGLSPGYWGGVALLQKFTVTPESRFALRLEYYKDKNSVIVPTGTPNGFEVWGASLNFDRQLAPQLLFRNEIRYLKSRDRIFPARGGLSEDTLFGVSSLALSF